jgi:hypothetical protein
MMSRKLFIVAVVLTLALISGAYAAVENIKVSGDIAAQGVARNFRMDATKSGGATDNALMDAQNYFLSQVRLRFDADLTENVSGTVRLINERLWGDENNSDNPSDIDLDLGFVEMKEFLYQPLTVIVGRQNLRYGNAMIIGDPDTNQTASSKTPSESVTSPLSTITSPAGSTSVSVSSGSHTNRIVGDLSLRKSFDSVRGILDFSPYTIDMIYARPVQGYTFQDTQVNLSGVNASYKWGSREGVTEGYFFAVTNPHNIWLANRGSSLIQPNEQQSIVYVSGARVQMNPVEKMTVGLEGAVQFGDVILPNDNNVNGTLSEPYEYRHLMAGAAQLFGEYRFATKYNPKVGLIYTFKTGDDDGHAYATAGNRDGDSSYNQWDPLFEDQTQGEIINILFANTNCHAVTLNGSLMPREDITVGGNFTWLAMAQKDTQHLNYDKDKGLGFFRPKVGPARSNVYYVHADQQFVGTELDAYALYDYTEDVQLKLTGAWFFPGNYFSEENSGVAYSARAGLNLNF